MGETGGNSTSGRIIRLFGVMIPRQDQPPQPPPCPIDKEFENGSTKVTQDQSAVQDPQPTNTSLQPKIPPGNTDNSNSLVAAVENDCNDNWDKQNSSPEEQGCENGDSKEKGLKKPDKILPCPRCKSMDTKFCYFNNYNINQPRHFCKRCQRYWTAGGTMRNVPVGAGRRKSKSTAATAQNYFQRVQPDAIELVHDPTRTNSTVLSFGTEAPSPRHVNGAEQRLATCGTNGFCMSVSSSEQSVALSTDGLSQEAGRRVMIAEMQESASTRHVHYTSDAVWPCNFSTVPGCYTSSIAIPIYPNGAYWGCMVPGPWGMSWSPSQAQAVSSPHSVCSVTAPSGNLPKEDNAFKRNNNDKTGFVETSKLGGDDLDESAKSLIRATARIKNTYACREGRSDLVARMFEPKGNVKGGTHMTANAQVLHVNPAAYVRSVDFQEGS